MTTTEQLIKEMVKTAIPIYTVSNPHPKRNRADCRLSIDYKNMLRAVMTKELTELFNKNQEKAKDA